MKLQELLDKTTNEIEFEVINQNWKTLFSGNKNFKNNKMKKSLKYLTENEVIDIYPLSSKRLLIAIKQTKKTVKKWFIEITDKEGMNTIFATENFDTEKEAIDFFNRLSLTYPLRAFLMSCEYESGKYLPDSQRTERELNQ